MFISATASRSACKSSSLKILLASVFFSTRRSSDIRPGQFGYGRVPFSLPLHRPNRQARHTVNGTGAQTSAAPNEDDAENNASQDEETRSEGAKRKPARRDVEEALEKPVAEEVTTTTAAAGNPHRHVGHRPQTNTEHGRARERAPPTHFLSRSSSPPLLPNRHRFNWHSVTAPPPPVPPLSRPNPAAVAPPFSHPLRRSGPAHRERELEAGFGPHVPPTGDIYPLQHTRNPHLGVESGSDGGRAAPQVFRCSGPEKEYRRCFSQVRPSPRGRKVIIPLSPLASRHINHLSSSLSHLLLSSNSARRVVEGAVGRGVKLKVTRVCLIGRSFPSSNTTLVSLGNQMETHCNSLRSPKACVYSGSQAEYTPPL